MTNALDDHLNPLLADYQILYQKLRTYHWTVTGPSFFELHATFERLYGEAAVNVDELAERILARGGKPLATLKATLAAARLGESREGLTAEQMVADLAGDLETLNGYVREASKVAEQQGDSTTFNLLEGMADAQEKTRWMLRAFLG